MPYNLQMGLGDSVSLELETDKPYTYHTDHAKQYPPGEMKKCKHKKEEE